MREPNPFLREGLEAAFRRRAFRRIHLALPAAVALLLVVVWPKGLIADFLRAGRSPQAFQTVSVALLLLLTYLGGRLGLEEYAREDFTASSDLAALPSVPVRTIVAGKHLFALLHTGLLFLLGLPLLTASFAVSGFGLPALGRACLVLLPSVWAARAGAVLLHLAADLGQVGRNAILFLAVAALHVGTAFLAPSVSPVLLLADPDRAAASAGGASFFALLLVLCAVGASYPALALRRRRVLG